MDGRRDLASCVAQGHVLFEGATNEQAAMRAALEELLT
jgi:hypothetical protein